MTLARRSRVLHARPGVLDDCPYKKCLHANTLSDLARKLLRMLKRRKLK